MARRNFATVAANNSSKIISADWVNDLDEVLDRGLAVTPQDFGAVADDVTDDSAAFVAALAYLKANSFNANATNKASAKLFVPAGTYYLGTTTLDITHTLTIEGEGSGLQATYPTKLRWAANTTGIRVQRYNTTGASSILSPVGFGGDGTIIRGLYLRGGYTNIASEGEYHGIHLKARAIIENCAIYLFQGDGIYSSAAAGVGAPTEGNSNCSRVVGGSLVANRSGMYIDSADANAWTVIGCDATTNRRWGFWDSSFLGNTFIGCHTDANGLIPNITPTIVSHNSHRYVCKLGQEAGASTNAPSGDTTDNTWWVRLGSGAADVDNFSIAQWTNGITVRSGGSYASDDGNAASVIVGCYTEGGQGLPQIAPQTMLIGGAHPTGVEGGAYLRAASALVVDDLNVLGALDVTGAAVVDGALTAASVRSFADIRADGIYYLDDTALVQDLGGGNGYALNGAPQLVLRAAGSNIAIVDSGGINLQSGKTLEVDGTKVLGAQGAAIADATDAASAITQLNLLLARCRAHGLIAT